VNFGLSDEQLAIKETARRVFDDYRRRVSVRESAERDGYDDGLWARLVELGWPGVAIAEEHGGGGLGAVEISILAEEAGRALAPVPLLGSVSAAIVLSAAGSAEQQAAWLPRLASGEARGAVGTRGGDRACARLVPDAAGADVLLLLDGDGGCVLLESSDATVEPVETIDPTRPYADVAGEGEPLPGDVAPALDQLLVVTAAELVGVSQRALELAVDHAKERRQFDAPIGSFQAVAHRCAEMLLVTENARSATLFGAWAADAGDERRAEAGCLAKIAAGAAGSTATASAIQVLGGIGFTWEADVHWLFKRARLDELHLGDAAHHRDRLAALCAPART
jgi:alkylation response protein AidB-like acyl-CoA dehydrogenase